MIEAVKDYLAPKRFHIVSYVCVIVHFLCGSAFTIVTAVLRAREDGKFSCFVDGQSTATYKKQVDQACLLSYDQTYNSSLPLYGFVLLSTGSTVLISVIYSLVVWKRVDEIESNHERQADCEAEDYTLNRRTIYVFYSYFVHLVLRVLFGIIFTILQHAYFYPNGFDLKFRCNSPLTDEVTPSDINTPKSGSRNSTSITCENAAASEKSLWGIIVSGLNSIVAFIILVEVINFWRRFFNRHSEDGCRNSDSKFVTVYFLGKQYDELEYQSLTHIGNTKQSSIHFYKQEVKNRPGAHVYIQNISLDHMYIGVIIHTERARHKFSKNMERHEIYDVYMKVPSNSIRLEKITDLFHPNEDTKDDSPRSILVIGRPGIGKTVLTEKLLSDWANEIDEFYLDKIIFFFKLRLFHYPEFQNISLKTFLQLGTRLDKEKIESIYQKIVNQPEKAIFIFDGLDECNETPSECLDQSETIIYDRNKRMSGMSLFIKLVKKEMLKGATVVVTSRPTASDFYSKLDCDRNVEITGFTSDKIEEYVSRFCNNKNRSDLKQTIWNHIKSSSELLNLCYIPVNCFIMCTTLYECLNDLENVHTNVLPKTLTELYERALYYLGEKLQRNAEANCNAQETLKKLQEVAFNGMEDGKLIFELELFDEPMKASGLLNQLSDSISPDQFCFTHLTIQEFLAARHVCETFNFAEIKTFISDHIKLPKWHLILQFISGLLSKKINKFPRESKDCISAFVEGLEVFPNEDNSECLSLGCNEVCVMKCLREVKNEEEVKNDEIVKDVCETTVLNNVVELRSKTCVDLLSNEWAAVTAVCKHMSKLESLDLENTNEDFHRSVQELLQKRYLKRLKLEDFSGHYQDIERVFSALTKLNCTLEHEHAKLTSLILINFTTTEEDLSNMRTFFVNGQGSNIEQLHLKRTGLSNISKLFEMLKSECCPKLANLDLSENAIYDTDAEILWDALTKGLRKLITLKVACCRLTDQCIPSLCKALQDKRCQLTDLSLRDNKIGDDGACMLLKAAHCKLTELCLARCFLTDNWVNSSVEALQDELCQLTVLSLSGNMIGDEGARILLEKALRKEHCKLTDLRLDRCLVTDHCVPAMVEVLKDERCGLIDLHLHLNNFTEVGERLLRNVETDQTCRDRGLRIRLS